MSAKKSMFTLVAALILSACSATPYQPMGFTGGYKDAHIKDNMYYVEIATNAYTAKTTAIQYFHRRAKEICLENGYKDYRVKDETDTSTTFSTGSYGYGNVNVSSMNKPGVAGYVLCIK